MSEMGVAGRGHQFSPVRSVQVPVPLSGNNAVVNNGN